jgi:hypothetical protein
VRHSILLSRLLKLGFTVSTTNGFRNSPRPHVNLCLPEAEDSPFGAFRASRCLEPHSSTDSALRVLGRRTVILAAQRRLEPGATSETRSAAALRRCLTFGKCEFLIKLSRFFKNDQRFEHAREVLWVRPYTRRSALRAQA